ncbi:protein kinase [Magnetovirga frankeli]|uniref:serine/threonine-protein kinase n=1 Tax=Magnetovirga frankeli TaxID=947516 RepID=UPI0012940482|nr:protein kinase [gamma proteobacterium SS-5]
MPHDSTYPQIPGYRIEALIAEGGMARVYRALQESLQRPVALKLMQAAADPSDNRRFLEEARTVAALRHPGIVTVFDIGSAGDQHFISMELVEGGDLESRIGKGMAEDQALRIVRQLAEALGHVHAQGVVHRDIKPANILFRDDNGPLLSDFGIAKQLKLDLKLTQADLALGSPYYLSPEQAQGKKIDGRSDIYSLGIVLYEMLSGKLPFRGKEAMDTILMHLNQPLPPLKKSLAHLQPLLERMTAKQPRQRYANAAQLLQALDELARQPPKQGPARPEPAAKKARVPKPSAPPQGPQPPRNAQIPGQSLRPWLIGGLLLGLFLLFDGPDWVLRQGGLIGPSAPRQADGLAIRWRDQEQAQLRQLLQAGRQALAEDRLSLPAGNSARDHFRQALQLRPGHPEALAGLAAIAQRYLQLAQQARQRGQQEQATRYIQRGLALQPDHPELRGLALEMRQ